MLWKKEPEKGLQAGGVEIMHLSWLSIVCPRMGGGGCGQPQGNLTFSTDGC